MVLSPQSIDQYWIVSCAGSTADRLSEYVSPTKAEVAPVAARSGATSATLIANVRLLVAPSRSVTRTVTDGAAGPSKASQRNSPDTGSSVAPVGPVNSENLSVSP